MNEQTKRFFRIFFIFAVMLLIVCSHNVTISRYTVTSPTDKLLLIDPGHGGEDGGASSANGTLEKSINLAISLDLRDILTVFGVPTQMTREDDVSIHDPHCTSTRQMKVSDMQNRLKLYESASMTVSIHQNHFSVAKYDGAQVFYSVSHPSSATMATAVREKIVSLVQPNNKRELKQATNSIFLLHKTTKPAILVECGFLSNPQECEKLQLASYRQQMAFAIAAGLLEVYQSVEE